MDLEVADHEGRVAVDQRSRAASSRRAADRDERAVGELDRNVVAPREARDAAGVIVVLVGDQDRGEIGRREAEARRGASPCPTA